MTRSRTVHRARHLRDDEYRSVSPGSYLSRHLIEQLFAKGLKRYYMGPGRNSYKTRWSKTEDSLHTLTAYAPTVRGRAAALLPQELKLKLRTLRDRLYGSQASA